MTRQELGRVTAKLLREVLAAETFSCRSDVKEALKTSLARKRIPYDLDTVEAACDLVESNRALYRQPEANLWTRAYGKRSS